MEYSSPNASLLSGLFDPPETGAGRRVLAFAVFLTVLLVGVVPVVALTTGVPVLAPVAVAGLLYAVAVVVTGNLFAGLCAAVFVLVTFAANVPVVDLPLGGEGYTSPQLDFLLVDVVAVPFAGLLLWWLYSGRISVSFGRERVVGYALAGFVCWSLLAAVVANGPSRLAALFYVVDQARYLLLFGIAAVVVEYVGIHNAVYSVGIAVFGQLAYAVAEILNHASFGLTRLGDSSGGAVHLFSIGPLVFEGALYPGGFAGTSRVLVGLVVLFVPVVVWVLVRRSIPWKLAAVVVLVASVFLVRVSGTDTGWMALLLTTALTAIAVCACWAMEIMDRTVRAGTTNYAFGATSAIGSAALSVFLFSQRKLSNGSAAETGAAAETGNSTGSAPSAGGASSAGKGSAADSETFVRLIEYIPFIDTGNVSIRFQQYIAAIDIGLQYPLFGLGGMNFPLVAESYGLPRPIAIHNAYLSVLAATGIPGAVCFLVAIVGVLVVIGKTALSSEADRFLWAMLACGVLGLYAYLFWVEVYGGIVALVFWVLAGAVVGASRERSQPETALRSAVSE